MTHWTYSGFSNSRRPTRTVRVGELAVGSLHPIRIQSMTTPSTQDTPASVEQIVRLVEAGCEIVRLTVPTSADADNLPNIRRELGRRGVHVPLVADIHFTPAAAMRAVEHVDKIRVNPGNYADKKRFAVREYTDAQYGAELERIERVFSPLVKRARELGVSMRIGTNHGSLSDRIMNRYGDTPEGMVESALEFVRICESHDYHELILSMKASNPVVVLHAYRLLASRMSASGMDYPIHLGVTEAGDGEDGRIKSAIGIGALLDDGIGDTVRVSLTEDPVREIPVARALVERYNRRLEAVPAVGRDGTVIRLRTPVVEPRDPQSYARRESDVVRLGPHAVGGGNPVRVEVPLTASLADEAAVRREIEGLLDLDLPPELRPEVLSLRLGSVDELGALERLYAALGFLAPAVALSARVELAWLLREDDSRLARWLGAAHRLHFALDPPLDPPARAQLTRLSARASSAGRVLLVEARARGGDIELAVDGALDSARTGMDARPGCLMLALTTTDDLSPLHATRLLTARLAAAGLRPPLVLLDRPAARGVDPLLGPSSALGGLLCDGIGDAIQIETGSADEARRLAFGVLQAARVRITRTEFISCPSCGRTLFDLEETTARIKLRTAHLKSLKIAVMGCVVNGPGEMADADFGYVGWGEGKIALFVGKEMVAKDIPTGEADERLVELIKRHGRWVDPPVPAAERA